MKESGKGQEEDSHAQKPPKKEFLLGRAAERSVACGRPVIKQKKKALVKASHKGGKKGPKLRKLSSRDTDKGKQMRR